jgi:hypothetical protein
MNSKQQFFEKHQHDAESEALERIWDCHITFASELYLNYNVTS